MTKEQKDFVIALATYVTKYAPKYGIKVYSPIIAQGILESAWGKSKLSEVYFNFFGLKCGSKWTGKSVNLTTSEEYTPGTHTVIKDNFRVYDSMEEGVEGYFEFIQLPRYANLKGITDPMEYLRTIRDDGYATASDYAADCYKVIETYDLTQYDPKVEQKTVTVVKESDVILYGHGSGTPAKHNLETYTTQRYKNVAPNGKHKGIAAVRRFKALTDEGRVRFEAKYRTILGRNRYSQDKRGYVFTKYGDGKYYSDCSSSGMATLRAIGYSVGSYLLNTAGIYYSDLFEDVPVKIVDGHIKNPEVLKVGDAVLYIGNDPKRPKQIGHVEWVAIIDVGTGKVTTTTATVIDEKVGYSGTFPLLPSRGYYKIGDGYLYNKRMVDEVKRVQRLLNWINGGHIAVDGKYGSNTAAACKLAQTNMRVHCDGLFGRQTLNAAKAYKKKEG